MSIKEITIVPCADRNNVYLVVNGEQICGIVRRTIAGRWACEFDSAPRITTALYSYKTRHEAVAALIEMAVA